MRVVRLRQPDDLGFGDRGAEHAAQIVQDDTRGATAAGGRGAGRPSGASACAGSASATADALVRSCVSDSAIARRRCRPSTRSARGAADDLRRAVVVARDGKIGGLDLAERQLARKELDAGLLGGKARGEARCAARPVAAVGELLRR